MKRSMKRVFSGILAMIMLLLVCQIPVFAANEELQLDTPMTVTPLDGTLAVDFKPEESAYYLFASQSSDDSDPWLQYMYDQNKMPVSKSTGEEDDYNNYDFWVVYYLNEGETYTLYFGDYEGEFAVNGFAVNVSKYEGIIHQPTVREPYIEVPSYTEVKSYQWYKDSPAPENKISDQTTNQLTDFEEDSDYVCVVTTVDDREFVSEAVTMFYDIMHLPTSKEPYVSVNNEKGASYQWYNATWEEQKVDDDLAQKVLSVSDESFYDESSEKWNAMVSSTTEGNYQHTYFEIFLYEGETLTVAFDDEPITCEMYMMSFYMPKNLVKDGSVYKFTADTTGFYLLQAEYDTYQNRPVKATASKLVPGDKVQGQETNTLTSYERDIYYYCEVSYTNGTTFTSTHFKVDTQFLRQPTAQKPEVEVTYSSDVKQYQWYEMTEAQEKITDQNAEPLEIVEGAKAQYDAATGQWNVIGVPIGMPIIGDEPLAFMCFGLQLKSGDVLVVEATEPLLQLSALSSGNRFYEADKKIEGKIATFTITEDGYYYLGLISQAQELKIKAFKKIYQPVEKVDGQTSQTLTKMTKDKTYGCVVTYKDDVSITSNVFQSIRTIGYQDSSDGVPPTGDKNALMMWVGVFVISSICLGYSWNKKRRYNR